MGACETKHALRRMDSVVLEAHATCERNLWQVPCNEKCIVGCEICHRAEYNERHKRVRNLQTDLQLPARRRMKRSEANATVSKGEV